MSIFIEKFEYEGNTVYKSEDLYFYENGERVEIETELYLKNEEGSLVLMDRRLGNMIEKLKRQI